MKKVLQQGFSLIELMIAMLLGVILLLGVMQVLISSSTLGTTSNNLSVNQDSARTVMNLLGGDAQRAGYKGCTVGGTLSWAGSGDQDWKVASAIFPLFNDGFGIRFTYGMDKDTANQSGTELRDDKNNALTDCLGKELYYRSFTYKNCTVEGKQGVCVSGFSQPDINAGNLVDNEFIEGVTLEKIVFTVPKADGKFREISVGTDNADSPPDYTSEFTNSTETGFQDILAAKLVTFYITVKTVEPRASDATGESRTEVSRQYSASYPLKNLGSE